MTYTYNFPSGLTIEFRGWTFGDLPRQGRDDVQDTIELLNKCTVRVEDPGPYQMPGEHFDWSQLVISEKALALCAARVAMGVPELTVDHRCTAVIDGQKCGGRMHHPAALNQILPPVLDLREIIEHGVSEMPDEVRHSIQERVPLTRTWRGVPVEFKLLTLGDLAKVLAFVRRHRLVDDLDVGLAAKAHQFLAIGDVKGPDALYAFLKNAPGDIVAFLEATDAFELLVDNELDLRCGRCSAETRVEIPLPSGDFWRPAISSDDLRAPERVMRRRG